MLQTTETRSRPRRRLPKAERDELTELEGGLQGLAARVMAEGCLTDYHACQLRYLLKRAGRVKKGERGRMKKLVQEIDQLRSQIKSALRAKGAPEPAGEDDV